MEAIVLLSFTACVAFAVNYGLLGYTWLSPVPKELYVSERRLRVGVVKFLC